MAKLKTISYFLFASFVFALIITQNPTLLTALTLQESLLQRQESWRTAQFQPANASSSKQIYFYRSSVQRSAQFKVENTNLILIPLWHSETINLGIHQASKSSPISDGERVYVGGDDSWFHAFSISGEEIWKAYLGDAARGIHSTAAVTSDFVYIGSYSGTLYCFEKRTGKLVWLRKLGDTIGSSPYINGVELVVAVETTSPNGYLVKLNISNGETIWRSQNLGEQAHSSPSYDPDSGLILVGVNNSTVQAFDEKSGRLAWSKRVGGPVKGSILISNGRGYFNTWGKEFFCIDVKSADTLWKSELSSKSQVSPVQLVQAHLVVTASADGMISAFHDLTGKLIWQIKSENISYMTSPIVVKDLVSEKIVSVCAKRKLCLINPHGQIQRTFDIGGFLTGSPFIDNKNLYIAYDESSLEAFRITF